MRYIWDTNPFYLMSAALLLYGVNLVSNGSRTFTHETAQLAFNFGALQVYGVLLVVTAILLVRRFIWYDSTLLVCLENALVLVPFILVTQAALIEQHLVWSYCAAGLLLACLRFASLRRWFAQLNLPARALGCGAVVLAVNAALPAIFRHLHESKIGTKLAEGAAYEFNLWSWYALLPALIAIGILFPKPLAKGENCPQKRWLPMMFFTFWIAATVTHLYSLGYVYDFDLRHEWVAPGVWALAWTLYWRITDFIEFPGWKLNRVLLIAPLLAPLVAGLPNSKVTLTLGVLNVAAYGVHALIGSQPRLARNLAFGSALMILASIPHSWGAVLVPGFNPVKAMAGAALAGLILPALLSRNPYLGFLGGMAAAAGMVGLVDSTPRGLHMGVQVGCVFLLLHSLRWADFRDRSLIVLRALVGTCWMTHSLLWAHFGQPGSVLLLSGGTVLGIWLLVRRLGWARGIWSLGAMAGVVVVSSPLDAAGRWMAAAPAGLLAVAGSFALFAIGTAAAFHRHRWQPPAPKSEP